MCINKADRAIPEQVSFKGFFSIMPPISRGKKEEEKDTPCVLLRPDGSANKHCSEFRAERWGVLGLGTAGGAPSTHTPSLHPLPTLHVPSLHTDFSISVLWVPRVSQFTFLDDSGSVSLFPFPSEGPSLLRSCHFISLVFLPSSSAVISLPSFQHPPFI